MTAEPDPAPASRPTSEIVPLVERLAVSQRLRAGAVLLVVAAAVLAPQLVQPGRREVLLVTAAYAGLVVYGEVLSRWAAMREHVSVVFTALIILDGAWLATVLYLSGTLDSPVRYLLLLHAGAVALLGSYRTGVKTALWHTLLLLTVTSAQDTGALVATGGPRGEGELAVFVGVLWLVAVSTSALSAVNERELRRRRRDLESLTSFAESVGRATGSRQIAQLLAERAADDFDLPRVAVLGAPDGRLFVLGGVGLPDGATKLRPAPSRLVDDAQQHGVQLVSRLDDDEALLTQLLPDARNVAVIPMSADDRPTGALVVEHPDAPVISRRVVAALERYAAYGSLALRNAWLLEQVQRLAATDGLTKIANRRTFEATLEREVARATRTAEHVSLVMVDIDHFKSLNDTHGHQAGDEVLRNVAAALTCECRDFDTPARYGGEEFAVVLPGCGPKEAVAIAERLRRAVSAAPSIVPITASAGVATYPSHAGDADTLVRAADEALYASKRAGRDRTTQSAGVPPEAQVDALLRRAVSSRLGRSPVAPAQPQPQPAQPRKA